MPDADKIKQELAIEVSFDEQSANKAIRGIEELGDKVDEKVIKPTESAAKSSKDLSTLIGNDLSSAIGKFTGALGPLASIAGAAGPIAALTAGFIIVDGTLADLEKTSIRVTNQFSTLNGNLTDIVTTLNRLSDLGLKEDSALGVLDTLSRNGAFTQLDQLKGAAETTAALSQKTGINPNEIAQMVSQFVKAGIMSPTNTLGPASNMLANFVENAANSNMALSEYTKSVVELWNNTKGYNMTLSNTERIVDNFSEELRKGIFSLSEIGNFATGKQTSQQAQLFLAQKMGIEGSPLEMLTKMQEARATPEGQNQIRNIIREMTKELSSSTGEQLQLVQKLSGIFAPELGVDNLRKSRNMMGMSDLSTGSKRSKDEVKAEKDAQKSRIEEAKETAALLRNSNVLLANVVKEAELSRSLWEEMKEGTNKLLRSGSLLFSGEGSSKEGPRKFPGFNPNQVAEDNPKIDIGELDWESLQRLQDKSIQDRAKLIPDQSKSVNAGLVEVTIPGGASGGWGAQRPITIPITIQQPGQAPVPLKTINTNENELTNSNNLITLPSQGGGYSTPGGN